MKDIDFIDAQIRYRQRDPRALAEFVRNNNLNVEQREFVAQALLGEVPQSDARKHKQDTEYMVEFYDHMKRHPMLYSDFADADIYRMLAEKFGIAPESVRKNISRHKAAPPTP